MLPYFEGCDSTLTRSAQAIEFNTRPRANAEKLGNWHFLKLKLLAWCWQAAYIPTGTERDVQQAPIVQNGLFVELLRAHDIVK